MCKDPVHSWYSARVIFSFALVPTISSKAAKYFFLPQLTLYTPPKQFKTLDNIQLHLFPVERQSKVPPIPGFPVSWVAIAPLLLVISSIILCWFGGPTAISSRAFTFRFSHDHLVRSINQIISPEGLLMEGKEARVSHSISNLSREKEEKETLR